MNAVIDFKRNEYEELCKEMIELLREEKELAFRKERLRKALIDTSGGERMEYGIKVQQKKCKGHIDYTKFIEVSKIDPSTLEFYRKEDRIYWEVRSY